MSNQRGFVFMMSLFVVVFLAGWSAMLFQRSITEFNATNRSAQLQQAFHLAEGGLDDARQWLSSQPSPPSGIDPIDPFNGPQAIAGGSYSVTIDPDDANPTNYLDLFTITVTGQMAGGAISRQLTEMVHAESFSRYSYFTNREKMSDGTRIWFSSGDHLWGPVQSNDQFNISGSPIFESLITSAASSIFYRNPPPTGGNHPQFNGGVALNAGTVTLPLSSARLRVAASSGGAWYTGNTTITLQADGTMLVTNTVKGWINKLLSLPANGAIFVNGGNVKVSGTMHGQLTIGTSNDLVILNNVTYADDPQIHPESTDILGLVAEKNVVISQSAPNDLAIQASLMALQSSFTVENWWVGPPKGTLSVYGGIIQDRRGPVGSINASTSTRLSGYAKSYRYDTRFSSMAPPSFPTTGNYDEILWQEQ